MKKLGDMLKAEREKKKLSLHEIGIQLKISSKILQAIESGDTAKLPAKTFLRGFVRSYAQFLRLDVNQALQLFQEEMGTTHPEIPVASTTPEESGSSASVQPAVAKVVREVREKPKDKPLRAGHETLSTNKIVVSLGILTLFSLILLVSKVIEKYKREQVSAPVSVVENPATPATADEPIEAVANTGETPVYGPHLPAKETPAAMPAAPAEKPPVTAAASPKPPVIEKPPEKTAEKPVEKTVEKVIAKPPEKTAEKPAEPAPAQKVAEKPADAVATDPAAITEVILEATGNITIKYDLGNGGMRTLELAKGQFHTFRSKKSVSLEINDGGLANIISNGKLEGRAGKAGTAVSLKYPRQ